MESNSHIRLVPLELVSNNILDKLREVRNSKHIRDNMRSRHIISMDEHFKWYHDTLRDRWKLVLCAISETDVLLGQVNATFSIDYSEASLGIFVQSGRTGIGFSVHYEFNDFLFGCFPVQVLIADIYPHNSGSIKLYRKLGFQESSEAAQEGGLARLLMTRSRWQTLELPHRRYSVSVENE